MSDLHIASVTKHFGETSVLKGVTLDVKDGEFISLVGPSGCGKSTLLRIIAGLETPTSGTIAIGGAEVTQLRAADRNLSMVFQSYALYPHLTVAENIAVPLQMRQMTALQRLPVLGGILPGARTHKDDIAQAVRHAAEMLEIAALLDRKPGQLSGGQRQRVALGRALVRDPAAFLLDEPLSNLDAKLRVQTRAEIAELHRRLKATFIYVTHDQVEAMTMSDRIAVMMGGEILQCAAPDVIYEDPDDIRVAEFIGSPKINVLPLERNGSALMLFDQVLNSHLSTESPKVMQMGLRPEALQLTQSKPHLTGRVVHLENLGSEVFAQVALDSNGSRVTLRAMPAQRHRLGLGAQVGLSFDLSAAIIFDAGGARLRHVEGAVTCAPEVA
ncbi:ABC transporter ATP-binding protein [Sulfitobacter sp. M57]|uniref:ABC transporter ATP-binding protein n=1 Tax=unclassified Sulfitobacter TaxID=196795 RepID=UPI0023E22FA8|nr:MULTISPECIES: ABC transporter ATP-binding protein [unclassified Sulfitobacter]MDF3415831.1 ABC transporter ATP-binding protein [Sulfitobacter sp. KE5]MDF3423311.1 ABC transporter ATP-binding protein [Sulfitobacter sp. KE43]MDF3434377.1 ABC transporter ATP-binding protein [Sulfitobacter sp. KE42]MDF3460017.1 ABC transporter ATP-binding protein [Sulfitobacter sp. S74]MDF3463915.1 ABC transporter ATP-binding protein [Sulfitobacter sp. Ks18]